MTAKNFSGRVLEFNLAPPLIVGLGGLMILVAMFMPALSSTVVARIENNLLIEQDPVRIMGAIAALISVIRFWKLGSMSSANLAIFGGLWFFGWTVFRAATGQVTLDGVEVESDAGSGTWTAAVGCLVMTLGGIMMRFPRMNFLSTGAVVAADEVNISVDTKVCPRCAETVKLAAKVCRFCNHEFEPSPQ